ncbi:hypothetical protein LOTGIDRAFT_235169 [Lottia gigantea]|uniref:Voltage-gated hydrogen channel 1 n=1 Tax=Lottia gigantea TaxID=225164 RepID=V4A123_LOTGI|nr:hypothetical protein LOTGIDRAFT_235169 [Lottia gigantea]ESO86986.1 hypothetical protein LOTGIDRAFT_235169 [Lottia gigantea]
MKLYAKNGEIANTTRIPKFAVQRKSLLRRFRKRLSILLHTHVALILVSVLAALDASCVIGQIICDILIMKEKLHEWELFDAKLSPLLVDEIPRLNTSDYEPGGPGLHKFYEILAGLENHHLTHKSPNEKHSLHHLIHHHDQQVLGDLTHNTTHPPPHQAHSHSRRKRAIVEVHSHEEDGHGVLHELNHAFHLGSMIILSILLFETLLKTFAMGRKILMHKLEVFDAFVVTVSWCLDIAFWEGIWEHPGTEAATILIFILPWRVVRIVNSFVLVIQEKDNVQLKIIKQRLRLNFKKTKEITEKLNTYRVESKQLQGLCRKHGATENEISACGPGGRRRRSSVMPALDTLASIALVGAIGNHPSLTLSDSSDEDDEPLKYDLSREVSLDPSIASFATINSIDSSPRKLSAVDSNGLDNPIFVDDEKLRRMQATRTQSLPSVYLTPELTRL